MGYKKEVVDFSAPKEEKEEKEMAGFDFKVKFLKDYRVVDTDHHCVEVECDPDYPEGDQDEAGTINDEWAEEHLDEYDADDYESTLANAY